MQPHSAIEHGESLLRLLDVEVGTGVEAAHVPAVDVEQPAQARAADRRSPRQRAGRGPQRRVGDAPAGELEQSVGERPPARAHASGARRTAAKSSFICNECVRHFNQLLASSEIKSTLVHTSDLNKL